MAGIALSKAVSRIQSHASTTLAVARGVPMHPASASMRGQLASVGQTRLCLMHSQDAAVASQHMRGPMIPRDLRLSTAPPSARLSFRHSARSSALLPCVSNKQRLLAAHADPTALQSDSLSLSCRCRLASVRTHTRWRCGANSALLLPRWPDQWASSAAVMRWHVVRWPLPPVNAVG